MDFNHAEAFASLGTLLQESRVAEGEHAAPTPTAPTTVVSSSAVAHAHAQKAAADPNDIWNENEIPTEDTIYDPNDTRPCPHYEIAYKQRVGAEDVFLGMSDKTPGSQDCTHLVVKIHFPGSTLAELDLNVTKRRIRAESPRQ